MSCFIFCCARKYHSLVFFFDRHHSLISISDERQVTIVFCFWKFCVRGWWWRLFCPLIFYFLIGAYGHSQNLIRVILLNRLLLSNWYTPSYSLLPLPPPPPPKISVLRQWFRMIQKEYPKWLAPKLILASRKELVLVATLNSTTKLWRYKLELRFQRVDGG